MLRGLFSVSRLAQPSRFSGVVNATGRGALLGQATRGLRGQATQVQYGGDLVGQVAGLGKTTRLLIALGAGAGVVGLGLYGAKMVATVAAGNTSAQTIANAWPNYVRERINKTYMAFGAGIVMTGTAMVALFKSGVAHRMATASPWAVFGLSLVGTIGTMMMTQAIPYENTAAKYLAMASFNTMIGLTLSPILFMGGGLALRAAAMTGGIVGSLSLVAANSPSDQFLWMAGPLSMGLGAIIVASLGSMFFPAARFAGMAYNLSLYGGLAVFSGFVLYDTSRIVTHAERKPVYDPINESISIYMDAVNIFIRLATIMAGSNSRRK